MSSTSTVEALQVMSDIETDVKPGYFDWLDFHNFINHIKKEKPYLVRQWEVCDEYGIPVDKEATGAAWYLHDIFFGVKSNSGFGSKEIRSMYVGGLILQQHGWQKDRIANVGKPINATAMDTEITDTNDLVVVRTDLNNIWGPYFGMASNAMRLRREEEKMCGVPIEFNDFKQRVEYRLGRYLARDMGLIEAEYQTKSGEALPNVIGKFNLNRFLNETPESLSRVLDIPESEIIATPRAA